MEADPENGDAEAWKQKKVSTEQIFCVLLSTENCTFVEVMSNWTTNQGFFYENNGNKGCVETSNKI